MDWKKEYKSLSLLVGVFVLLYYIPMDSERFTSAILEALHLAKWYAQEHVLLCLVPAFFIAGAIAVFISQSAVMKYLGPKANKWLAYGVSSISGSVLAVCSCTVLPLFAGIYRMGAGLGPATAFLYSGPAINVLAIILTSRILGLELGIARAVGAIVFSIVIGLAMHLIFYREEQAKAAIPMAEMGAEEGRPLWQTAAFFAILVGILIFANWGAPSGDAGLWAAIYAAKWMITAGFAVLLGIVLVVWYNMAWWKLALTGIFVAIAAWIFPGNPVAPFTVGVVGLSIFTASDHGESTAWFSSSWGFAKQIMPLLLIGVLIAGALLGRPGQQGLIPPHWIANAVGGNSLMANFIASFAGAFMYFATLTEVPILQGLLASGMGKGPALALLLAGPALSLPNMLVIRGVMGNKKTIVFVLLVVVMATLSGLIYGTL